MKVFVSVTLGAALALTGIVAAQEKYSLSIATGGTGGVYYPLGGGLANLLSKYVPGLQATAEVTGGSVDNLKLIGSGKPYIAFSMADAGQDAYRGEDKFKVIDDADAVAKMNKKYGPLYIEDVIPKATYRGMDTDNKQATVWNILVSHEKLSDQTAYAIVKTIFDKRDDLIAVHKEAENFRLENQKAAASPIPFHPGAAKYFVEQGVKLR